MVIIRHIRLISRGVYIVDDKTKYVWRMWGKWYGYPDCCIDAFCKSEQRFGGYFNGTGFVPCAKCYDKPVEDLISQIKINRWSSEEILDRTAYSPDKEESSFTENFWQCMEDSYDRNTN